MQHWRQPRAPTAPPTPAMVPMAAHQEALNAVARQQGARLAELEAENAVLLTRVAELEAAASEAAHHKPGKRG